jgi:Ice-binding-like
MSNPFDFRRGRSACVAIAVCFVCAAIPISAKAAAVNLATAQPFVVLSGAGVTNTGPSVLNGDLGVSPGTSLTGFGLPAVVNGATHANDAVAAQAQSDLTTAYNVAAGQPVPPGNDLTGTDLGGRTLTAGAYGFSSSAGLTGQLTLDAQGNPNAQFVFVIGTTLTTATASSVVLTNGASPCNVYWKVGSSATLGTSTSFEGNLMALQTVSLNSSVTVLGRVLARNGEVTLINDVLGTPQCATGSTPTPTEPGSGSSAGTPKGTGPKGTKGKGTPKGSGTKSPTTEGASGTATVTRGKKSAAGVTVTVHGKRIGKVTVTNNGSRVGSPGSPREVRVPATPGAHTVTVHVHFTDSTKAKTFTFHFRVPTPVLHPHTGPSQFTG